ncbi:MAG TPA: hypothetical protein VFD75_10610 [Pyrinomonadaceae bacterium]|nr:hypothetical protein [Pyrinomonadaceae bacterium]
MSKKNSQLREYRRLKVFLLAFLCVAALAVTERSTAQPGPAALFPNPKTAFALVPQQFAADMPKVDANCLLLNPQWQWQIEAAAAQLKGIDRFPDSIESRKGCTAEDFHDCVGNSDAPWLDETPVLCPMCFLGNKRPNRIHGHVNWFPATYTGTICFHDLSFPDMDYTFSLQPDGEAGLTRWNNPSIPDPRKPVPDPNYFKCGPNQNEQCEPRVIHVEFDSRETIERFVSDGWTAFRDNASPCGFQQFQSCHAEQARKDIELKQAVVVGLVGLDSEHSIYSELHPAYAMAVQMSNTRRNDDWLSNDTWLVFARDRGNEGACSAGQQHKIFGLQKPKSLQILIPAPKDRIVTGVSFTDKTKFFTNNASSVTATYYDHLFADPAYTKNNRGVLLSFDLRDCESEDGEEPCSPLIEGELHLQWQLAPAPAPGVPHALTAIRTEDHCTLVDETEKQAKEELRNLTTQQKKDLYQLLQIERARGLRTMALSQTPIISMSSVPLGPCSIAAQKVQTKLDMDKIRSAGNQRAETYSPILKILNRRN